MSEYACTECSTLIEVDDEWGSSSYEDKIVCPKCNTVFELHYNVEYDYETEEEYTWPSIERVDR